MRTAWAHPGKRTLTREYLAGNPHQRISTPAQAHDAALVSDGAVVGSALVRLILDGADASQVESFISSFRHALD